MSKYKCHRPRCVDRIGSMQYNHNVLNERDERTVVLLYMLYEIEIERDRIGMERQKAVEERKETVTCLDGPAGYKLKMSWLQIA